MTQENGYKLISHKHPKSAVAEAYRTLRTNLGFAALNQSCGSILVTSPGSGDGKSTIAANLAVVLSQAGHKVVIVDCDLRKPMQHKIFEVENHRGITNCLLQNLDLDKVAYHDLLNNLTLITSGPIPPNPAELLGSPRVRTLWPMLLERFEYLIIDSPPVLAVTDAALLSSQVDGVLLAIRAETTRVEIAKEAKDQLIKASANLVGVILNRVKMPSRDYYYHYHDHQLEIERVRL